MADAETLPATTDESSEVVAENNGGLAVNGAALPDQRRFAADSIRAPLPPAVYERLGQMVLSPEQEKILDEPLPADEVDIRPDDGMIYASHEYVRRVFNRAFGRMGWTLIPGSPLAQEPGSDNYYRVWILFVGGIYCSEAMASRKYLKDNARMSLDDVAEAIKSDCLRRCAKDLGIAHEVWNKRFAEKWRKENAIEVVAQVRRQGQMVNAKLWRRKDQAPLPGEQTSQRQTGETAGSKPAAPNAPPQPPPPAAVAKPKPEPPKPANEQPKATAAAVKTPPTPSAQSSAPRLLDSQIRLLFARGRNCGLIVGDDATPMLEYLAEFGVAIAYADGKTSTENCTAAFKEVPPSQFTALVKKLDEMAKVAKPAESGQAEKI